MKITIIGKPHFVLGLDLATVQALIVLSEQHYDGACRAAGRPGGFLWGWRNRLTPVEGNTPEEIAAFTVEGSFRDLDTALKISELSGLLDGLASTDRQLVWTFVREVSRALSIANQQTWRLEVL